MSLRRGVHRALGRLKSWAAVVLPTLPGRGDRLVIAPQDLRTADPTRAAEIYSGRFAFAGKIVICDGRSPFEMIEPSEEWGDTLLGFGWLRHLRAADTAITRANARALVDEWINLQGSWNAPAWQPEILSRRIISWLTQATLILDEADVAFYRRFLRSLTRQVQFLRSTASDAPRRRAAPAGAHRADLCRALHRRPDAPPARATRQLVADLERQILPDGGHASRNPGALIELLLDLLPLRAGLHRAQHRAAAGAHQRDRPHDADAALLPARRRHVRAVQRHGPDAARSARHADRLRRRARHAGHQRGAFRLSAHRSGPYRAADGHRPAAAARDELRSRTPAACRSSCRPRRSASSSIAALPATGKDNWREFARSTRGAFDRDLQRRVVVPLHGAAPRAATLAVPIVAGPTACSSSATSTSTADRARLARRLRQPLQRHPSAHPGAVAGRQPDSTARICSCRRKGDVIPSKVPDEFAVRFHLHPAVRANRVADGHGVMLIAAEPRRVEFLTPTRIWSSSRTAPISAARTGRAARSRS